VEWREEGDKERLREREREREREKERERGDKKARCIRKNAG
jgi:hypothetical protein